MLKKLLKYDIRYISKTFLLVIAAIFVVGALTGAAFGGLFEVAFNLENFESDTAFAFGLFSFLLLYFASIIGTVALVSLPSICVIVLYYRFYRNLYTDQGYLSFTLPLKPTDHLHSKLIVSGTTMVILDLFVLLGAILAGCIALLICQEAFQSLVNDLRLNMFFTKDNLQYLLENFDAIGELIIYLVVTLVANLVMRFANICLVFFDITFACSIVKKYKLLASIGMYLVVNGLVGGIVYTINMVVSLLGIVILPGVWGSVLPLLVSIALYIPIGIVSYFLNRYYINNKLNLQ